jgi:hypothetical protein
LAHATPINIARSAGGSFDSVQAPVILITAFLRLASSTTFGRSAQGCGGAGGALGLFRQDDADADRPGVFFLSVMT